VPISIESTIGSKYGPAMEIVSQWAADTYFEKLVNHQLKVNDDLTREEAERIERKNLGYFAGYYSHEVRARVERLFRCAHPFFGAIAENGPPSPEKAFKLGMEMYERHQAQKIAQLKKLPAKNRPTLWERLEEEE